VSRQSTDLLRTPKTTEFAGVTVDADEGRNITVRNNELYDYSGHGVLVDSAVTGLGVQNNTVTDAGGSGIRVTGETDGVVDGNRVQGTGEVGIHVEDTAALSVRGNYVGQAGTHGILAEGSERTGNVAVTANYVTANNQRTAEFVPAVSVGDVGAVVRGNTIEQAGSFAIREADGARRNLLDGNWADGDRPWSVESPETTVRNHTPPVGVHRDRSTGADGVVRVEFDRPYARAPKLSFGRTGGGVRDVRFSTDDDGDFVGVTLTTADAERTLDLFVDDP
jgi:parallel beta-helix repeat protein